MKTKTFKLLLVFSLLLFLTKSNNNVFAQFSGSVDDYEYEKNNDGENTITLTKYIGTGIINYIPDELDEIERDPNTGRVTIKSKYYPTRIKATTYEGKKDKIRDANIPDSIIEIESGTFKDAPHIGFLHIGSGIKSITSECFKNNQALTSVTGISNVETIEDEAFSNCPILYEITLGEGLKTIGRGAFSNCSRLFIENLPSTVTTIGDEAFLKCKELRMKILPESLVTIGNRAFYEALFSSKMINMPKGLKSIGDSAFTSTSIKYAKFMTKDLPTITDTSFDKSVTIVVPKGTKELGTYLDLGYAGYNVIEILYGDKNNDTLVNSTDAALLLDMYKNNEEITDELEQIKLDMNCDEIINSSDSAMILDIYKGE